MQNYQFYHPVVRSTIDCPIGLMTSVLSEELSATNKRGIWLLAYCCSKNIPITEKQKSKGDRPGRSHQEVRNRNRELTMHERM